MIRLSRILLISLSLGLTACSTTHEALTPLPAPEAAFHDPDDSVFMTALEQYIRTTGGPQNSRYEFTRIDLDNDGRREGMAIMTAPFANWCDMNGCRMLVFKANNDSFTLVSEISTVRGPLTVSENRTNGWRDLVARISGHFDIMTRDVALQFNGQSYPGIGPAAPTVLADNDAGVKIFP